MFNVSLTTLSYKDSNMKDGKNIHHIHKWPPCKFEKFKMSTAKERIEQQERLCQNESLCVVFRVIFSFDENL